MDPVRIRANLDRVRERIVAAGGDLDATELCVAIKYVEDEDLPVLAEAGVRLVGENRADRMAKAHARHGELFEWDFIGVLQSRKVKQIVPYVELIHSVASDSALRQLEKHGTPDTKILVEVNVAGEQDKAGIAPDELGEFIARCPVTVTGLMAMPPFTEDPEASRPHFAALKRLADDHGLKVLSMGTSQDYRVAAEEGATIVRLGTILYE